MRTQFRALAALAALSAACFFSVHVRAEDSASSVRTALSELESWLNAGPHGKGWSDFLKLSALHAELDKGEKADPAVVGATLKQINSGAAGLDHKRFSKPREALRTWSEELGVANAASLSEAAASSEGAFRAIPAADVAQDKNDLRAAMVRLDQVLAASGSYGPGWKNYLRWNDLEAQLNSETPDLGVLSSVHQQYVTDQNGLEMPAFADVANRLARYLNGLASLKEDLRAQYVAQLKGLADELKQYDNGPAEETAVSLGLRLGWLENNHQSAALVRAIRNRYSLPNLQVEVSGRLAAAGFDQKVDETGPVTDCILGTSISGTGHTVGKTSLQLRPSQDKALLETILSGSVETDTIGINGPATIYAEGVTQIQGNKQIAVNDQGFSSYPATASASTQTDITGISAKRRFIEKIATKKAAKSKPEAEAIAASHAEDRIRGRMDTQASEKLGKIQGEYLTKFRNPLLRRKEFPALLNFNTSNESLFVTALQANRNQLGAPVAAPGITVPHDIAVRVHESMINNATAALLGGLTLKEEELQKKVIELRGSLPDQLKSDEDRDPWSITFAKLRPITIKFADNGFQVTVRGQRYTSGEREFRAMNVTADYKFEISGSGSKFVRQGELQIVPPGFAPGQTLSVQQVTLKTLLQRKFGKLFEQEIKSEGLVLPGKLREAGRLDMKQLQANGGWLVMAWIESGVPAPPEKEAAKVAQTNP